MPARDLDVWGQEPLGYRGGWAYALATLASLAVVAGMTVLAFAWA